MSTTARLGLPMLSAAQAQKELFHNESLQALDAVVAAAVEEPPRNSPPPTPAAGATYLVGAAPTGVWAGKAQHLACHTSGGWRLIAPLDGMAAFVRSTSVWAVYRSGAWELGVVRGSSLVLGGQQVVGARASAIATPAGGATVDAEARAALSQVLSALRQHGLIET